MHNVGDRDVSPLCEVPGQCLRCVCFWVNQHPALALSVSVPLASLCSPPAPADSSAAEEAPAQLNQQE